MIKCSWQHHGIADLTHNSLPSRWHLHSTVCKEDQVTTTYLVHYLRLYGKIKYSVNHSFYHDHQTLYYQIYSLLILFVYFIYISYIIHSNHLCIKCKKKVSVAVHYRNGIFGIVYQVLKNVNATVVRVANVQLAISINSNPTRVYELSEGPPFATKTVKELPATCKYG